MNFPTTLSYKRSFAHNELAKTPLDAIIGRVGDFRLQMNAYFNPEWGFTIFNFKCEHLSQNDEEWAVRIVPNVKMTPIDPEFEKEDKDDEDWMATNNENTFGRVINVDEEALTYELDINFTFPDISPRFTDPEYGDVVLNCEEYKFHVSKLFLRSQSEYFNDRFSGRFGEGTEVEIEEKDPFEFHTFLLALHGEPFEEASIPSLLELADYFDTPSVRRRCDHDMMMLLKADEKNKNLETYFLLALEYRLPLLKKQCIKKFDINNINRFINGNEELLSEKDLGSLRDLQEELRYRERVEKEEERDANSSRGYYGRRGDYGAGRYGAGRDNRIGADFQDGRRGDYGAGRYGERRDDRHHRFGQRDGRARRPHYGYGNERPIHVRQVDNIGRPGEERHGGNGVNDGRPWERRDDRHHHFGQRDDRDRRPHYGYGNERPLHLREVDNIGRPGEQRRVGNGVNDGRPGAADRVEPDNGRQRDRFEGRRARRAALHENAFIAERRDDRHHHFGQRDDRDRRPHYGYGNERPLHLREVDNIGRPGEQRRVGNGVNDGRPGAADRVEPDNGRQRDRFEGRRARRAALHENAFIAASYPPLDHY